mgnify:CR=1 FL=1
MRRSEYCKGFTLLEVMIAVAILAASLTALLSAVNGGVIASGSSRDLTTAMFLAERKLSEIELGGYPPEGETEGDFGDEYPRFNYKLRVATPEVFSFLLVEGHKVDLTIKWKQGKREKEFTLTLFVFPEKPV